MNSVDVVRLWLDAKDMTDDMDMRLCLAIDQFELNEVLLNDLHEVMAVLRYEEVRRDLDDKFKLETTCCDDEDKTAQEIARDVLTAHMTPDQLREALDDFK